MTIHLQPDDERIISEAVRSGQYSKAEEVIAAALALWRREHLYSSDQAPRSRQATDLVELFANSPFAGLDMDFERDRDAGRDLDL